jgi:hypothetical protein
VPEERVAKSRASRLAWPSQKPMRCISMAVLCPVTSPPSARGPDARLLPDDLHALVCEQFLPGVVVTNGVGGDQRHPDGTDFTVRRFSLPSRLA